jgi:restriction system protein
MLALLADNALDGNELARMLIEGVLRGLLLAWPVTFGLLAIFVGSIILGIWRRIRLARSGIKDIDQFSGKVFEEYLEVLFRRLGYRVERTQFAGDYGGDLVISKDDVRTVVQAKRYSRSVGVRAVQEVVAAKAHYDCAEAMVVTNNRFTKQAEHLADRNGVELWDRDELTRRLMAAGGKRKLRASVEAAGERHPVRVQAAARSPQPAAALADVATCRTCAKVLTAGERGYCQENAQRFLGQMFCFRHQRQRRA